jgi:hypothetical protein
MPLVAMPWKPYGLTGRERSRRMGRRSIEPFDNCLLLPHVHLVGVDPTDFTRMLENIKIYRLLPRDALTSP